MSTTVITATEIPAAPYYVLSDDAFMSDWGGAEGRVNTIILPASSREEAEIVATNARNRDEQRNVRILDRMPALSSGVVYSLLDKASAARWYTPRTFEPEPTDQPYNGWSNYKTWVTNLWITNDEDGYDAARAAIGRGGLDALRAYVEGLPDIQQVLQSGVVPASGLAADLYENEQHNARETRDAAAIMHAALATIDWPEIVEALHEE
jgi:hypothetical protein